VFRNHLLSQMLRTEIYQDQVGQAAEDNEGIENINVPLIAVTPVGCSIHALGNDLYEVMQRRRQKRQPKCIVNFVHYFMAKVVALSQRTNLTS